jgi:choline dehydrogenase-like flavoprotein
MATNFDVIIVGSGAGGGMAAYVLTQKGKKVALIEKGRNAYPTLGAATMRQSLFGNDELRRRRYFGFHDAFSEPRTLVQAPGTDATVKEFQGLGTTVGGGTVFYDGDCPRVQETDLRALTAYGPVAGANLVDWPIAYSDLADHYDAVERLIGVQGAAGADPTAEKRGPYPMPPGRPPKAATVLSKGAKTLGYHPHPMPMANNSIAYRGRPACVDCGFCSVGCPIDAKGSTAVTVIRDALLSGNLTLLSETCATKLLTNADGSHATGVDVIGPDGATQTLTAEHVILAANAIETPRLLLASANTAHPDGIGNSSGQLGRNLMFHTIFAAIGVFEEEIRSYRSRVVTHAMGDFTVSDGSPNFLRGGYVELGGQTGPIDMGISVPRQVHKQIMVPGRYRRQISSVSMIGEDMPQWSNRVELDPKVKDIYGRPVARVTYVRHPRDQQLIDHYMPKLKEIAQAAGATQVLEIDFVAQDGVPETKHLLGTTRMGDDPKTAVTNRYGRLHDVDNVWVADGGVYPTSTGFNPTLTQQALAHRMATYLADPKSEGKVLP